MGRSDGVLSSGTMSGVVWLETARSDLAFGFVGTISFVFLVSVRRPVVNCCKNRVPINAELLRAGEHVPGDT